MARALIVGCGCRGSALGGALIDRGWAVRGSTRDPERRAGIEQAGVESAVADPDRIATVLELIDDVAIVFWLMGGAVGEPEVVAAIHGPRLERLLEEIVDTPVRGLVYEAEGRVQRVHLDRGAELVEAATARWRVPTRVVRTSPANHEAWLGAMVTAGAELTGQG